MSHLVDCRSTHTLSWSGCCPNMDMYAKISDAWWYVSFAVKLKAVAEYYQCCRHDACWPFCEQSALVHYRNAPFIRQYSYIRHHYSVCFKRMKVAISLYLNHE